MNALLEDLRRAADLITQPLLLEVLVGTESGHEPQHAVPADADPAQLHAAVHRLATIGAVRCRLDGASGPLTLTDRGEELLRLLREIETL